MLILDTSNIEWQVTRKTCPLKAKPMVSLLVDRSVLTKFLVDTLEAREPVKASAMMCIGEHNDAWQQTAEKLLKQYDVKGIDEDGWMLCHPKPENSREFFEVTKELLKSMGAWEAYVEDGYGFVKGEWGEEVGGHHNLQRFVLGDFILRNREDTADQWRVAAKIYRNTYRQIARD